MSIPSELGHLAKPVIFLACGKNQLVQASLKTSRFNFMRAIAYKRQQRPVPGCPEIYSIQLNCLNV